MRIPVILGGTQVPAGLYRNLSSGHLIFLSDYGTLPGSVNSEKYVKLPESAIMSGVRERSQASCTPVRRDCVERDRS